MRDGEEYFKDKEQKSEQKHSKFGELHCCYDRSVHFTGGKGNGLGKEAPEHL